MPDLEEEKKAEITKAKFIEGLDEYTSWTQVKNFIKNSPAVVKTMTLENIQLEIENLIDQIDEKTQAKEFLENLKIEVEAI